MSDNKLKANISSKRSSAFWILLSIYVAFILAIITLGFFVGSYTDATPFRSGGLNFRSAKYIGWYFFKYKKVSYIVGGGRYEDLYIGSIIGSIVIMIVLMTTAFIPVLISNRKRKLIELTASDSEVVGSYTAFIPITKITLRMPIEKIDNISAVNSFFFLFTGKAIRIGSASSVIKIPYVLNADEVVAFIYEAIEKLRNVQAKSVVQKIEHIQNDYAGSLKKLAELRDAGIITEEEFNQKKNELLGKI